MLSHFFQARPPGAGFFKALNTDAGRPRTASRSARTDACLPVAGLRRPVSRSAREAAASSNGSAATSTRRFATSSPRPDDDISPRWQGLSAAMTPTRLAGSALGHRGGDSRRPGRRRSSRCAFFITNEGDAACRRVCWPSIRPRPSSSNARLRAADRGVETCRPTDPDRSHPRSPGARHRGRRPDCRHEGRFHRRGINNLLLFAVRQGRREGRIRSDCCAASPQHSNRSRDRSRIVGHTDDVKPRKSSAFKSNYDLSVARAKRSRR